MTHGTENEPGWHLLKGKIEKNGNSQLRLIGVVNNAKYAINDAAGGKTYSYRILAQFETEKGTGERLTGRTCTFKFQRH